ncbi:2-succinylbenzoate--CoA ligase [Polaribacter huanghezhanensis]|uniref:AMP-binding protein n=1 Tax=Polaribacter huanghezhanensis TaxID=1354726 RepID=UPI0026480080|nr:AMP-binding protein [Polaribacter huanghezhanensis]WKD84709.1 2-succinylbenzoate--CoA ligase [Polaribacter huanghezhanensis]
MNNNPFHIDFKLNGNSFSTSDELILFSKEISGSIKKFFVDWFSDSEFIEVQTSGSTGKSKTIQLKKEFMINSALATGTFFNLKENTTALLCMSTDFIAGKMMLVRALVLGWNLDVIATVSNPLEITNKSYDFSAMVPMQLENSLSQIDRVQKLIVGGAMVSEELVSKIQNLSTNIFATFGMTETITHVAVKQLNGFKNSTSSEVEKSHFTTLPNVSIAKDTRNCLVINAPKVSDTKIVTNDVVKIISKNKFKWLGRIDHVINSGGIKLHPEKIEKKLSKIISQRFFVTGIKDTSLGEKLILIVEGKKKPIIFSKIKSLSRFETPKEIYFVDTFIETTTKKIQRKKTLDLVSL